MICCENCFQDIEIKAIIARLGHKGHCEICHSENVSIYDANKHDILVPLFEELLAVYKPVNLLSTDYPPENLHLLKDELRDNWDLFAVESNLVHRIVTRICAEQYAQNPELFNGPVGIGESMQQTYRAEHSLIKTGDWEGFVKAIKMESRFHTRHINIEVLQLFCSYAKRRYEAGAVFYRARLSDKNGFSPTDMGAPPWLKASAGRANPQGIPYLHVATDELTTLKEIRAGAHDYVTIATFMVNQPIDIVDLSIIDKLSAFSGLDCTQHAINKVHLRQISREIARPLRRSDSSLDYLPTQYICDFIKSISDGEQFQYHGIKYQSTISPTGHNLAIFDSARLRCTSTAVVEIRDLQYTVAAL